LPSIQIDELVKSPKTLFSVIPAEAGIQEYQGLLDPGACPGRDPGFAGVTTLMTFCEAVKIASLSTHVWCATEDLNEGMGGILGNKQGLCQWQSRFAAPTISLDRVPAFT